ncbi:MAG TPA: MtrB/PioB family outer membrane beta-barrel protein [Vicinamibacterales bacterium]|nr:MtrB/PioB family outer membrane beta-barrel protein [Vicinamibacterales bacterium]
MQRLLFASLCGVMIVVGATRAHAQATGAQAPATGAQAPATAAPAQPPAPGPQPPALTGPLADDSTSLFAPRWNMFQLSGRLASVEGDPARWQRYEDLRDGLLFTTGRLLRERPGWAAALTADNLGWRDQRYSGSFERIGRFSVSGLWDQIPQFYSVDTRTPFTSVGEAVLVLDDSAQRAANLNAYPPLAPQFDLRERRDIGTVLFTAMPSTRVDVTGHFTTTKHSGELPWGADFGFGNDNEVALPYRSRTNDVELGAQWTNTRAMIRGAYNGSWFNNLDDTLVWDNPLVLNDSTTAPGRGRTALWPSNSMQTMSTAGYVKLARRTQVTGSLAYGWWNNDEPLLPFTINSALTQLTLPRTSAEAAAHTIATNLNFVSRPQNDWRFSARFRRYDYNNETPETPIPQFINYDTSIATSPTGGPELFAHNRNTFDADATWSGLGPLALTVGYTNNHNGYDFRTFESSNEHVLQLKADAVGSQWVTFRANYEYGKRTGSGLDEASLIDIGEQPQLRHYDLANRTRNRFVGQVDIVPTEALTVSLSGGVGNDDFEESYFGLQEAAFRNVSVGVDYQFPRGLVFGTTYNYERYSGLQRSRSANPGEQEVDPNRDWTADSLETVHYVSVYVQPPRIGRNTEARLSYDYSYARGNFVYGVGPALPPPSQLPRTFNKLQDLRVDVRHRLNGRLAATVSYVYEPYRIFDFAFDPSVINSIVQPSSLVLGYTYRPYTTHSAVFGLLYHW